VIVTGKRFATTMREPVEDLNRVVWNEVSDEQERCRASLDDLGSAIVGGVRSEEGKRERESCHTASLFAQVRL